MKRRRKHLNELYERGSLTSRTIQHTEDTILNEISIILYYFSIFK